MEYRVEELADASDVNVRLIRAYQSKGLLPPPRRDGRVAFYTTHHRQRLREIQELKAQGHSLLSIGRLLEPTRPTDTGAGSGVAENSFNLHEVSERTGVPTAILRSLESAGLIRARPSGGERAYTEADVQAVRLMLGLIGGGLPIDELIHIARKQSEALEKLAAGCVELFVTYGREPIHRAGLSQRQEAERVVAALRLMLQGTTSVVAYNFQRMVLNAAYDTIVERGTRSERAALRRELQRRLELPLGG